MDKIKRLLRINTHALNFQLVYSILLDQYFSLITKDSKVNIPFINFLYKSYPEIMIRIFRDNYSSLYGYILKIKHSMFRELIVSNPQLLVECIRLHLEKSDIVDVYSFDISNDKLDGYITERTVDSLLSKNESPSNYEAKPDVQPKPIISSRCAIHLIEYLTKYGKRKFINLDSETPNDELLKRVIVTNSSDNLLRMLLYLARCYLLDTREILRYENQLTNVCRDITATTVPGNPLNLSLLTLLIPSVVDIPDEELIALSMLQNLKISLKLLHNIVLIIWNYSGRNYNLLFFAFQLYPLTLVLSEDLVEAVIEEVPPLSFFRDVDSAINYYSKLYNPGNLPYIQRRVSIPQKEYNSYEYIHYSILENIPEDSKKIIIDNLPDEIKKHNAAQLANRVLNLTYKPYLKSNKTYADPAITDERISMDYDLLVAFLTDKVSVLPKSMTYNSLEELLDYYLPLIPETSVTAILLLLLYNSATYSSWINVFKKHKRIMQHIIRSSTILQDYDKRTLLTEISIK